MHISDTFFSLDTTGPLASALTNKYGCRVVTIAGSIIGGTGFVLSVFAPNLYYLYFSCGIMAGASTSEYSILSIGGVKGALRVG